MQGPEIGWSSGKFCCTHRSFWDRHSLLLLSRRKIELTFRVEENGVRLRKRSIDNARDKIICPKNIHREIDKEKMTAMNFNQFINVVDQIGKLGRRFSSDLSKSVEMCRPKDLFCLPFIILSHYLLRNPHRHSRSQ